MHSWKRFAVFTCVDEYLAYGVTWFPLTVCISLYPRAWCFYAPFETQEDQWQVILGFVSVAWARTSRSITSGHLQYVADARKRGEQPPCACHKEVW